MLGLNPMEQEIVDLTNKMVKDGFIYFPEFCKVVQKKFREEDEDLFRQNMFKVGTIFSLVALACLGQIIEICMGGFYMFFNQKCINLNLDSQQNSSKSSK